ncbi:MAG: DUF4056 domain-containing protein, partial [Nanoarchaeota archaeon]
AHEVSADLAPYLAFISTVWHEIITWYGYSSVGLFSEKPSSFSWEDLYSDLMGSNIASESLKSKKDFEAEVTSIMRKHLIELDVQEKSVAKSATKTIRGKWFSGMCYPAIHMMKRSFDIGLDNGCITPWLVPGICKNPSPKSYCFIHHLENISQRGFSFKLTLFPKEMQSKKILKLVQKDEKINYLLPETDFLKIVESIKQEAIKEQGVNVGEQDF